MKMLWKKWTKAAFVAVMAALMLAAFSACSNGEESDETTKYTVTFDSKDGSDVPSQSVENGKKAVEPKDPHKSDVTFGGWYEGETPFSFSTAITGDITLTAKWISEQYTNNSVTLTFYDDQTFEYKDADGTSQGTYTKTGGKITATFTSGSKKGNTLEVDTSGSGPSVSVGGNEVGGFEQVEEPTNQNPQDNDSSTPASGAKLDGTALYRFGMTNLDCDFNVKGELTNFGDTGSFLYYPVALNLDTDTAELSATISVSKAVANSKLGVGLIILNDNHSVTGFTFATTEKAVWFLGGTSSDVNADGSHGENGTSWDDSTLGIDDKDKKTLLTENIPYTFKVRLEKKGIAFTVTDSTDAIAASEKPHDYTELVGNNGKAYLAIGSIRGDTSIITYSNINVTINDETCTIDSIKSRSSTALDETALCRFGADQNCDFDSNGVLTDFGGSGSFLYYPVTLNLSTDIAQLSANITVTNAIERMGIGIIVVDDDGFIASHVIATTASKVRYFGGTKAPDREHAYGWNNSTLNANNAGNKVVLPTNVPYTFKVTLVGGRIFFSIFDSSGNLAGDISESYSIWLNSNGKVYFAIGAFSGDTSNIAYSDIKVRINDGQCTINSIKDGISSKIPYLIISGKTVIGYRDDIPAKLTIPNGITAIEQKAFMGCTSLTSVTIPEGVTTIGSSAFRECTSLQSVVIPKGVTVIDNSVFWGCTSLTSINIPDSVKSIGNDVFTNCSLSNVTIPYGVESIGKFAFCGNKLLTNITIPHSVTSLGPQAFWYCESLASVTISQNVTKIDFGTFQGCYSLTNVVIPDGVTSIGEEAFKACTSLTSITIPNTVNAIGQAAFSECATLDSATIPIGVTTISPWAFGNCYALRSVTIPNTVTSIADNAFVECIGLTSITIPSSVKEIGSYAFFSCSQLTNMRIPQTVTSIGEFAFYEVGEIWFDGTRSQWEKFGTYADIVHCTDAVFRNGKWFDTSDSDNNEKS